MTHGITPEFQAALASETTTFAILWLLTRTDREVFAFTDFTSNITYNGVTFKAATGFVPSTVKINSSMAVDNMELDSILDSTEITETDLMAGLFDFAAIEMMMVNYTDLTQGVLVIKTGTLGNVSIEKGQFTVEVRGIAQQMQQLIGKLYSPSCSAILGDSRCTKDLTTFTFSTSISIVASNQVFSATSLTQDIDYFTGGVVHFTSGNASGISMEVKAFISQQVTLALPMPFTLQVGDTFTIIAGCDKVFSTCQSKFNNVVNFRGFPKIPGTTAMLQTAGTIQPLG